VLRLLVGLLRLLAGGSRLGFIDLRLDLLLLALLGPLPGRARRRLLEALLVLGLVWLVACSSLHKSRVPTRRELMPTAIRPGGC
jgi:hypothetical protein